VKKKKIIIGAGTLFLTVIILAGGYLILTLLKPSDPVMKPVNQPMMAAFQAAKAQFCELKIQGWAKLNNKFCTLTELNQYADEVEKFFAPDAPLKRETGSDAGFQSLTLSGPIKSGISAKVIFQSLSDGENENETYLILNFLDSRGAEMLALDRQKMTGVFRIFKSEPEINQLLVGHMEGKLVSSQQNGIIEDIFQAAGGKVYGGVVEEYYISKTGFVPNLIDQVQVGTDRINMQAAMSYNEIDNKTYLYIGSPLVFSDY